MLVWNLQGEIGLSGSTLFARSRDINEPLFTSRGEGAGVSPTPQLTPQPALNTDFASPRPSRKSNEIEAMRKRTNSHPPRARKSEPQIYAPDPEVLSQAINSVNNTQNMVNLLADLTEAKALWRQYRIQNEDSLPGTDAPQLKPPELRP